MRKLLPIFFLILIEPLYGQITNRYPGERPGHNIFYINDYAAIFSFNPCDNKIVVNDASDFFPGDTVLIIQMKGAVIDSSNTASFGDIIDYRNCGNYEFNYVKSVYGNAVELKNRLNRKYDIPDGKVQLVRVPYYQEVVVDNPLVCQPWNGSTGGVLAFIVR